MTDELTRLIGMMRIEMGRWPTDEEVEQFIFGDADERAAILKKEKK